MKTFFIATLCLIGFSCGRSEEKPQPPHAPRAAAPLTIKMQSAHPRDIARGISNQTGVPINFFPPDLWKNRPNLPTSVSVDADQKSFWEVMKQLCDAAKLHAASYGFGADITLQESSVGPGGG